MVFAELVSIEYIGMAIALFFLSNSLVLPELQLKKSIPEEDRARINSVNLFINIV